MRRASMYLGIVAISTLSAGRLQAVNVIAEQAINLGDSVTASIITTNNVVKLPFYAVKDTQVNLSVQAAKGATLNPSLAMIDGLGDPVDISGALVLKGTKADLKKFVIPSTGDYAFLIGSVMGTGNFTAKSSGKFPTKYTIGGTVPDSPKVNFDVQPGSTIKGQVKANKDSTLLPIIVTLEDKSGLIAMTDNTAKGSKAQFKSAVSAVGGTCTMTVGGSDITTGAFTATLNVKAPKSKQKFDISGLAKDILVAYPVSEAPGTGGFDKISGIQVTVSSQTGKGSKDLAYEGLYNMTGSKAGLADFSVDLRAAYDANNLYMRIQWTDPSATNDLNSSRWYFNEKDSLAKPDWALQFGSVITSNSNATVEDVPSGWSSNLNDDNFAIMWALGDATLIKTDDTNAAGLPADTTFSEKGCAVGCHTSGMAPTTGLVDIWDWQAALSNPIGYVSDQWSGNGSARKTDTGETLASSNLDIDPSAGAGPMMVLNPVAADVTRNQTTGEATIAFTSIVNGPINLDGRLFLTEDAAMPIESTDAVGGQTIYQSKCQGCHNADGRGESKNFSFVGLTWTRTEIVDKANAVSHGGGNQDLDGAGVSAPDTDKLVARIRGFAGPPGYLLAEGDGTFNAADTVKVVNFGNVYNSDTGQYTVIVTRKLTTADTAEDVEFNDLAKTYPFGLAIMDFDGKNHAGAPLLKLVFQPAP